MKKLIVTAILLLLAIPARAGDAPPPFQLQDLEGNVVKLSDYLGKNVIYLDFWATFCKPCLRELPYIDEYYKEFKDRGFIVFAINADTAADVSRVRSFVQARRLSLPVLLDKDSKVLETYNSTRGMPYGVLINSDGKIAQIFDGYKKGDELLLKQAIEKLLAPPAPLGGAPSDAISSEGAAS